MKITGLIAMLEVVAENDLEEGADIFDHPCSVAVRALKGCMTDINILRGCASPKGKSKTVQTLIKSHYDPGY